MINVLLLLTGLTKARAVETLQSQIDYSSSSTEKTTSPAWPKLSLDSSTATPSEWIFSPHTRAQIGPETTTLESVQVVTPVTTISEGEGYQRHMLPYTSDKKDWQLQHSNTVPPPREKLRRLVPAQREVEVSIPKIFVDMAFTGHYSKISVPRNRVR